MQKNNFFQEFWIPALAALFFFFMESWGHLSEIGLTIFILGVSSLLFYWNERVGEMYLFGIGTATGFLIEVVFRVLGYQQVWKDASLFGVPFWLPLAWGMGFVLISRLGIYVRGIRTR